MKPIFKCLKCKYKWSVRIIIYEKHDQDLDEDGKPTAPPYGVAINWPWGGCLKCKHEYFEWINYENKRKSGIDG